MSDGVTPLTVPQAAKEQAIARHENYFTRDTVALDVALNVLCGGHPDETISSRSARAAKHGYRLGRLISKFLDLFQPNHGALACASDVARAAAIVALEQGSGIVPKVPKVK